MINKKLPIILFLGMLLFTQQPSRAQSALSFSGDLMSRYIWRGLDLGGPSPCIQPTLKYSYTFHNSKHNLAAGAWGSYTFSGTANEEIDLFASYTFSNLVSFTVTDYFFPGLNTGQKNEYFRYQPDSTGHVFEGTLSFQGTEKFPVTLLFSMNFYGNDARKMDNDSTQGDMVMSKYIEIGYRHSFREFDFNAWIGAALDKPDKGYSLLGYYMNQRAGVINAGLKVARNIQVSDRFSIPVQCQLIANPMQHKVWMVLGITI